MSKVIEMGFVDPNVTDLVTQPDFDAIQAAIPEGVPWLQQDHSVSQGVGWTG
jgi:hypothetical protein